MPDPSDNLLRSLSGIVDDLWGAPDTPADAPAATPAPESYRSAFPPFDQLWKTADETVDWTDALAHAQPADGLTPPALWAFFHSRAQRVLHGDIAAYLEVLKAADPLGDLSPYARAFDVEAADADCLRVRFDVAPAYLAAEDAEIRRCLAAIALRAARDLMALLPLRQVDITGQAGEALRLHVSFERSELQKVRFTFIDPVSFTIACGGEYA